MKNTYHRILEGDWCRPLETLDDLVSFFKLIGHTSILSFYKDLP